MRWSIRVMSALCLASLSWVVQCWFGRRGALAAAGGGTNVCLRDVDADLDAWAASGLVEVVFLDEVSNSWAASSSGWADDATTAADHEAFYAEIFAAARSRFSFVVANPGSPYPLSYLDDTNAPDVVVLSEAAYATVSYTHLTLPTKA